MGLHDYNNTSFDNKSYGFKRVAVVNLVRVKCKCGYTLGFFYNKPMICPVCRNYVYPDKKYEFKERLKKEIKKHEKKED